MALAGAVTAQARLGMGDQLSHAEQYAAQDGTRREALSLRDQGTRLVNEANRALTSAGKQLDKMEKKQVKADIAAVQKALAKKVDKVSDADIAALHAAIDQLERSSAHARDIAGK